MFLAGGYFADILESGELMDDEYAFCALSDENEVIGFGALMRESCIENKEYIIVGFIIIKNVLLINNKCIAQTMY